MLINTNKLKRGKLTIGTLDESVLSKAIEVLTNIAGNQRQIGIISHVDRLEESIQQKIVVKKTDKGSTLYIES